MPENYKSLFSFALLQELLWFPYLPHSPYAHRADTSNRQKIRPALGTHRGSFSAPKRPLVRYATLKPTFSSPLTQQCPLSVTAPGSTQWFCATGSVVGQDWSTDTDFTAARAWGRNNATPNPCSSQSPNWARKCLHDLPKDRCFQPWFTGLIYILHNVINKATALIVFAPST